MHLFLHSENHAKVGSRNTVVPPNSCNLFLAVQNSYLSKFACEVMIILELYANRVDVSSHHVRKKFRLEEEAYASRTRFCPALKVWL